MQPHPSPPALASWPGCPVVLPACCWMTQCIRVSGVKHNADAHHTQEKPNHDSRELSPACRQPLSSGWWQTSPLLPLATICSSMGYFSLDFSTAVSPFCLSSSSSLIFLPLTLLNQLILSSLKFLCSCSSLHR